MYHRTTDESYRRQKVSAVLLALLLIAAVTPGAAQQPDAAPVANGALPDAIILVEPFGDQATVAVTYSRAVPHEEARKSVARLAKLAGWKLGKPAVKDQELFGYSDSGQRNSLGKQTGLEVAATGVNLFDGGAIRLQPFAEAYKHLDRFDLFVMMGGFARFTGLRSFDHPALAVRLVQGGGPYRYSFEIRDRGGPLPTLPIDEPARSVQPDPVVRGTTQGKPLSIGPVLIIAACAGLAVFAALRILSLLYRRGRTEPPAGRRPLQSGPYIVPRRKD